MKTRTKIVAFAFALLLVRMFHTGSICFAFLVWNLFLAWLPYYFCSKITVSATKLKQALFLALTILFLPNAPYILTDLFHLKKTLIAPLWMDTLLILSFALAGLTYWMHTVGKLMALLSERSHSRFLEVITKCMIMFLSAYGIYLGRYLRFNSWDVVAKPTELMHSLARSVLSPLHYKETLSITLIFSAFLYLLYELYENRQTDQQLSIGHEN